MTDSLRQNFSVTAGDDIVLPWSIIPIISGGSLAGAQIFWTAYKQLAGTAKGLAVLVKSLGVGIVVTSALGQTFTVRLSASDTALLEPGNYYHEAWIVDASGNTRTVTVGIMTIDSVRYTG
jgi:hypothetical protein